MPVHYRRSVIPSIRPRSAPCWEDDGSICAWLYDVTGGNETVSRSADWIVVRPLQVLAVLLVAWVTVRLLRRWVRRSVERFLSSDRERAVRRLGGAAPVLEIDVVDPRRDARTRAASAVLAGTVSVVVWLIAVLTMATIVGIPIGPLIAGAGVAGIAVSFGAQALVKDWISGLFMLIEDQFGIGDVVDLGEASGVVERFSLRSTTLRGVDGTLWHVPNGEVVRVGNRSQLWSVALLDVDVAYDADLATARQVLHETAVAVCSDDEVAPDVLEAPEVLGVERLGADGITLRLVVKTVPGRQWSLQRRLREAVKASFDDRGIEIPFPQRTVWMRVAPGTPEAADPTEGSTPGATR